MSPVVLLLLLVAAALLFGGGITAAVLAFYRWWVPGSTVHSAVGPLRLPWWAAWVLLPGLVLCLLGWALAAAAGSKALTRVMGRAALFFFAAFCAAWAMGAVGSYALQVFFPLWLRRPIQS